MTDPRSSPVRHGHVDTQHLPTPKARPVPECTCHVVPKSSNSVTLRQSCRRRRPVAREAIHWLSVDQVGILFPALLIRILSSCSILFGRLRLGGRPIIHNIFLRPEDFTLLSRIHIEHLAVDVTAKVVTCQKEDAPGYSFDWDWLSKTSL